MIFSRKAYDEMLEWKTHLADRYALLVEGARRVGKTFLLRQFMANEYKSHIYIDFASNAKTTKDAKRAFTEAVDIADLIFRLELIFAVKLLPGESCIVFDEVQLFPDARGTIKSLVEYGRFHYIESGSLVGIKENVKDILIPSEEHKMKMYPLDFEEFLDALGETLLKEHVRSCFNDRKPLAKEIHDKAMRLWRTYMVVGGMPQSVEAYLSSNENRFEASETAKREILSLYDSDIGKYAKGYASKVRAIFRMMPSALSRREKRFNLADLGSNSRMRRYENAFLWLADAMVANIAYNSVSPDVGLGMNLDSSSFKCYSLDTGLLLSQSMSGRIDADARLLRAILHENIGINEGMFVENAVAQTFASQNRELFFYSRSSRTDRAETMEVDFLLQKGFKVCPVEVKSSSYRTHASLDRFVAKFARQLGSKYVICRGDCEFDGDGITYLPFYMAHCL